MKQMLSNGEIIIIVGNIQSKKYPLMVPFPILIPRLFFLNS